VYVYRLIGGPANAEKNHFGRYPDHVKFYQFGSTPHTFEFVFLHTVYPPTLCISYSDTIGYIYISAGNIHSRGHWYRCHSKAHNDFIFVTNSNYYDHMYFYTMYRPNGELSSLYRIISQIWQPQGWNRKLHPPDLQITYSLRWSPLQIPDDVSCKIESLGIIVFCRYAYARYFPSSATSIAIPAVSFVLC